MTGPSPAAGPSCRYAVLEDGDEDDDEDPEVPAEMEVTSDGCLEEGWEHAIAESLALAAAREAATDTPAPSGEAYRGSGFRVVPPCFIHRSKALQLHMWACVWPLYARLRPRREIERRIQHRPHEAARASGVFVLEDGCV